MISLILGASASALSCKPLVGAHDLFARPNLRFVMAGEAQHGTAEAPAAAADLICAAVAAGRTVVVAVEHSKENQAAIDGFMASDGSPQAQSKLLGAPAWRRDWADGKSSLAMLGFFDWLRRQRQSNRVKAVVAFDADSISGTADRERQMADNLLAISPRGPDVIVVLSGSYHSRTHPTSENGRVDATAATLLPKGQTIGLQIRGNGGYSWSCYRGRCGIQGEASGSEARRGIFLTGQLGSEYDGVLELGVATTASDPAGSPLLP